MQTLTFEELAELRLLLQPGLEVKELAVAAVHRVISHLLQAARAALTLQGCLILRRKQQNDPYRALNNPPVVPASPRPRRGPQQRFRLSPL